ncbi:hypothetical protein ACFQJ5_00445 [Halomicroarcula sp. GCM10025324]|uniref:hypothetical protein n=1 Tax=Haloarcula TaxID=2237 RepID=UPI0023E7C977|nr:hypothetical protein [Halomicroarcula sp. ZS-22-S1]
MKQLQVGLLVLIAVLAVVAVPAVSAQTATGTATETPTANESDADSPALGTQLTAFLQSNSAAANDSVENGMWKANFERAEASQRERLVDRRAGTLERRLERLEARNETLRQRYEDGSLSRQAYVAQQTRLSARIDGLQTAVDDADTAATRSGVDNDRLARLRQSASELTGPEVAEIARGLGGGPPADRPGQAGPPESDEPTTSGNETAENTTESGEGSSASGRPGQGQGQGAGLTDPGASATDDVVRRTIGALLASGFA